MCLVFVIKKADYREHLAFQSHQRNVSILAPPQPSKIAQRFSGFRLAVVEVLVVDGVHVPGILC
jgi:hypothetical protein